MKAIECTKYGSPDVLKFKEVTKPVPLEDEVLIKVHAASINSRDWRLMRANPLFIRLTKGGFLKPNYSILGVDVAGRVEEVGSRVKQFKPGDEVFGYLSRYGGRTFAEYVCAGENEILLKPDKLSFEQSAAVPLAALTALQALRSKGNIQPGQKVLINGASGGVGTFAVQIAKALGAEVTAVCSTRNLQRMWSLSADYVIDYRVEDFTQNGKQYDLILAVNGYHPIADYLRALKPGGTYVVVGGSMAQLFEAAVSGKRISRLRNQKTYIVSQENNENDLVFLKELLESGKIVPVIDRCFPLSKTSDAFRYFEKKHPGGKVVISMDEGHSGREDKKIPCSTTNRYTAYCGIDCNWCPQFGQNCKGGCLGTACADYCATCSIRLCNLDRQFTNCAQCGEYPCQKLEKQFEEMVTGGYADWANEARKVLEELRRS